MTKSRNVGLEVGDCSQDHLFHVVLNPYWVFVGVVGQPASELVGRGTVAAFRYVDEDEVVDARPEVNLHVEVAIARDVDAGDPVGHGLPE